MKQPRSGSPAPEGQEGTSRICDADLLPRRPLVIFNGSVSPPGSGTENLAFRWYGEPQHLRGRSRFDAQTLCCRALTDPLSDWRNNERLWMAPLSSLPLCLFRQRILTAAVFLRCSKSIRLFQGGIIVPVFHFLAMARVPGRGAILAFIRSAVASRIASTFASCCRLQAPDGSTFSSRFGTPRAVAQGVSPRSVADEQLLLHFVFWQYSQAASGAWIQRRFEQSLTPTVRSPANLLNTVSWTRVTLANRETAYLRSQRVGRWCVARNSCSVAPAL